MRAWWWSWVPALVAISNASPLHAQTIDLASGSAQYMPSAKMGGAPGSVQVASYDAAVNVPIPISQNKVFVVPGANYHVDAVSFANTAPQFVELRAFQSIDVSTLIVQLLPNNSSIATRTSLGIAGDFQTIDSRTLRSSALLTASHAFSKRFVLGGGALTSFSFGSFLPLPALYVDWKPVDGLELEGFLPTFVHARYTFFNRVRVGVLAELNGNEYAVRDARIRNAWPCRGQANDDATTSGVDERIARPAECFDNLAYSVGNAGLAFGVRLGATVWLTGLLGHSFFRRLDRRNSARDLLSDGRDDIPNVLVVRTGIVWRLPGID